MLIIYSFEYIYNFVIITNLMKQDTIIGVEDEIRIKKDNNFRTVARPGFYNQLSFGIFFSSSVYNILYLLPNFQ